MNWSRSFNSLLSNSRRWEINDGVYLESDILHHEREGDRADMVISFRSLNTTVHKIHHFVAWTFDVCTLSRTVRQSVVIAEFAVHFVPAHVEAREAQIDTLVGLKIFERIVHLLMFDFPKKGKGDMHA